MSYPDPCQVLILKYERKKAEKVNKLLSFELRNISLCHVVQICEAICLKQLGHATNTLRESCINVKAPK